MRKLSDWETKIMSIGYTMKHTLKTILTSNYFLVVRQMETLNSISGKNDEENDIGLYEPTITLTQSIKIQIVD